MAEWLRCNGEIFVKEPTKFKPQRARRNTEKEINSLALCTSVTSVVPKSQLRSQACQTLASLRRLSDPNFRVFNLFL